MKYIKTNIMSPDRKTKLYTNYNKREANCTKKPNIISEQQHICLLQLLVCQDCVWAAAGLNEVLAQALVALTSLT